MSGEVSHVPTGRWWSETRSSLTRPILAAQVKTQLNTSYPLQATLYALAEYNTRLQAEVANTMARQGQLDMMRPYDKAIIVFFLAYAPWEISMTILSWVLKPPPWIQIFSYILWSLFFSPLFLRQPRKPEEDPKISELQQFESLMVETLGHRQLEILCRYGDYLAERLGTLRQHIAETSSETEHSLSEY